jgi:hypothetical protein
MAETISQPAATDVSPTSPRLPGRGAKLTIPAAAVNLTSTVTSRLRNQLGLASPSPVNQNGSFEFDRVIKSGYVQKRTQKTKVGDVSTRSPDVSPILTLCSLGMEASLPSVATRYHLSLQVG